MFSMRLWTPMANVWPISNNNMSGKMDSSEDFSRKLKAVLDKAASGDAVQCDEPTFDAIEASIVALMNDGRFEIARSVLSALVKALPTRVELKINLALCQMQTGLFDDCFKSFDEIAKVAPDEPSFLINRGTALYKVGRFDEAVASFKKVVSSDPDNCYANLAMSLALLKDGRLKEGWPHWESRLKQANLRNLSNNKLPLWTPSAPSSARVLVRCEQGFGDSVFFARTLPLLRTRCSHVTFLCRPELLGLFKGFPGIDELLPLDGDEVSPRGCDFRLPLASLPQHFIASVDAIPKMDKPCFKAPSGALDAWRDFAFVNTAPGTKLRAGICWSGSPSNIPGRMRSIPFEELLPLLRLPDVTWFSLQADSAEGDADAHDVRLVRTAERIKDFSDTAALIESLDVVVSIDTAVAHLAGAMLKPVRLALCCESDWRWFTGRDDSPWYPSMRLFRQVKWGDWSQPIARIVDCVSGNDILRS